MTLCTLSLPTLCGQSIGYCVTFGRLPRIETEVYVVMKHTSEHFKQHLLARRDELNALEGSAKEGARPVELDQQSVGRLSRMDALQMQSMAQATKQRREEELQRIDAALKRIEADEYGECLRCGEEIAPQRLELDPSIALCVNCASHT